jgi:hypothetical protein
MVHTRHRPALMTPDGSGTMAVVSVVVVEDQKV